ncbi:MAG TPA: hypothetical protein VI545_07560 [Burkholderiales bacterium]|nr:hypothetical protein [Burkholderiales bacterium]
MTRDWNISLTVCCALAAAAISVPAPAQERLGRLFFTPAQRASLDVARSQRARAALSTEKPEQEAAPVPQTITYSGVLRRSDGKTTVWINNQPVHDRESAGAAAIVGRVRPDGSVTLQVPQSGRSVSLKPGQSVELLSGTVEEGYSRKLEAPRPEPKPAAKPAADAKSAKPATPPDSAAQREREERETQRLEDAISRALVETASARPGAAPGPAIPPKP